MLPVQVKVLTQLVLCTKETHKFFSDPTYCHKNVSNNCLDLFNPTKLHLLTFKVFKIKLEYSVFVLLDTDNDALL